MPPHGRIAVTEPVLQQMHAQHRHQRRGRTNRPHPSGNVVQGFLNVGASLQISVRNKNIGLPST